MHNRSFSRNSTRFAGALLIICLLVSFRSSIVRADAGVSTPQQLQGACVPGTGWTWTTGPSQPEVARQAETSLMEAGIEADVIAQGYGEKDSCDTFELFSMDYALKLKNSAQSLAVDENELADRIMDVLAQSTHSPLGNVQISFSSGRIQHFSNSNDVFDSSTMSEVSLQDGEVLQKKVYLLVYDPILSNGQRFSAYMGWPSYSSLVPGIIEAFHTTSGGQLQYTVVDTYVTTSPNEWPIKLDGFRYTEQNYISAYQNGTAHEPTDVNYDAIVGKPQFDICGKLNRGEIDELWIYGGPYDGFYESRLVGPNGYWLNSPPMTNTHGCTKLLPIMGLNFERGVAEALHSFGHRSESIMVRIHGDWQQNRTSNNWERYSLVKSLSPNYSYSGCGNIHFPPNGVMDYDYYNSSSVLSNCDDFQNYPDLGDPVQESLPVDCTDWTCIGDAHLEYMKYWYDHLPSAPGCTNGVANNWWLYLADLNLALTPSVPCPPPDCPTITDWKGEYWSNSSYIGPPLLCRNDPSITFDWGLDSPDALIPDDDFSIRWTRTIDFNPGAYRFHIRHDDGARLYIDGVLKLSVWDTCCVWDQVDTKLTAGPHTFQLEYFEDGGGAHIELWWEQVTALPKPSAPALLAPLQKSRVNTLQPTFDWKDSQPVADYYQVQISSNGSFTALVTNETNISTSTFTITSDLIAGKLYYWRVRGFNSLDEPGKWSTIWSFKTPLSQTVLVVPANGASLTIDRPSFGWDAVNDAGQYILQVSATDSFSTLLVNVTVTGTEYSMTKDLPQKKTIYWRVRAKTPAVTGPWSARWSFKTGNPPTVPVLVAPANGALVKDYTPVFNWNNSTTPAGTTFKYYEIQWDEDNQFAFPVTHTTTLHDRTDSDFMPPLDLASNTKYYWRVRAVNTITSTIEDHTSGWSPVWLLRAAILPPTGLTMIPNALIPRQPSFTWDAASGPGEIKSYTVQISTTSNFSILLVNSTSPNPGYAMLRNLPIGKLIYWRVRVNGPNGPSAWSTVQYTTP